MKPVKIKHLFKKLYTRERDLVTPGYWHLAEAEDAKCLTEGQFFYIPLFIYEEGKGLEVYYDFIEPKSNPKVLHRYLKEHPEVFHKAVDAYESAFHRMDEMLKKDDTSLLPELLKDARVSWGKKYPKRSNYADLFLIEEVLNNTPPTLEELQARAKSFIYYNGKLHTGISREDFAKEHAINFFEEGVEVDGTLKGQVAFKGKVRGRVHVFITPQGFNEFREGDILVAPMTTPTYMPVIRKASAIITDEGGITCHAAIVARELKKPCLIGTKVATTILETGMEVLVDADDEVVTILSSIKAKRPK